MLVEADSWHEPYGRIAMLADPFGNGVCLIEMNTAGYDAPALFPPGSKAQRSRT